MKPFIIIFVLIVSTECGLLDDLVSSKSKTGTESKPTENRQNVLVKVGETLKNGTKVVIDALGNVIRISPKDNENKTKSKDQPETSKATEEAAKTDNASKPDLKTDLPTSTEKVKDEASKLDSKTDLPTTTEKVKDESSKPDPKTDLPTSTEKVKVEAPKLEEKQNKTLPTEANAVAEDTASSVKNTTDSSKPDSNTAKNCTNTGDCSTAVPVTRSSFKGDECPAGKSRADDGTCVDEI